MITGTQIRSEVGRIARGEADEPWMMEVVNSSTTASTITDLVNLAGTGRYSSQAFQGWTARWNGTSNGGLRSYGLTLAPATGTLSLSPATVAPTNGDTVELWNKDAPDTDYLDRLRDRCLTQNCFRSRLVMLGLLSDGDMLAAGTTSWTGTNATLAKTTGTGDSLFAEQVLTVTNTSANGYAGQTLNTEGGEVYQVVAVANCQSGTQAQITVQDLTAGSALSLSANPITTWTGTAYQFLRCSFTVPSTSKLVSVRVGGSGVADVTNWAFVAVWDQDARLLTLPTRIKNLSEIGEVYELTGSQWPELVSAPINDQPDTQEVGGVAFKFQFRNPIGGRMLGWMETTNYDALQSTYTTQAGRAAGDAATTNCPLEYIAYTMLDQLYPPSFVPIRGVLRRMPGKYEEHLNKVRRKYAPPNQVRIFREQGSTVCA